MAEQSDLVAELVLKLKDEMSGGAEAASKAFARLRDQIKADQSELASMKKALKDLSGVAGTTAAKAMEELKAKISAKEQALGVTQAAFVALGGEFKKFEAKTKPAGAAAKSFAQRMQELNSQASSVPGPIGRILGPMEKYATNVTAAQLRTALLTSAFLGMAGAAALGVKSLFEAGLASAEAARNEHLHLEALTKLRNMWGIAPGNADQLQEAITRVSAGVSISREKVAGYAEQLYRTGLRGDALATALEGASIKASALGDSAGSEFVGLASTVNLTGGSVKRFANDVKARFGGIVDKQMQSTQTQALKMQEAYASLFSGLKIEGFLRGMSKLRGMLSQSTESGRALKQLLTLLLQPLFEALSNTKPLQLFFHGMIIGAQEMAIAFLLVRNWIRKTFGGDTEKTLLGTSKALGAGKVVVYSLAAAFAVLAVSTALAFWPWVLGAVAIAGVLTVLSDVIDFWGQINWSDMAKNMIDGFIGGLERFGALIHEKVTALADTVKTAFASALKIQSPSKVFAELGANIPAGVAVGIERGVPKAQSAAESMIRPKLATPSIDVPAIPADAVPASAPASAPTRAGKPGKSVSIGELHIHSATDKPKDFAVAFRRALEDVLEGASLEAGAR